jgi:hypothetical protein
LSATSASPGRSVINGRNAARCGAACWRAPRALPGGRDSLGPCLERGVTATGEGRSHMNRFPGRSGDGEGDAGGRTAGLRSTPGVAYSPVGLFLLVGGVFPSRSANLGAIPSPLAGEEGCATQISLMPCLQVRRRATRLAPRVVAHDGRVEREPLPPGSRHPGEPEGKARVRYQRGAFGGEPGTPVGSMPLLPFYARDGPGVKGEGARCPDSRFWPLRNGVVTGCAR